MKKLFLILLGLIAILITAATIFLVMFDLNSYRETIMEKATEALGRPVTIGSLNIKKSLIPTIEVRNVAIGNPAGMTSDKPFLTIDNLDATLAVIPLFSKKVEIQRISLGNTTLNLIAQNGHQNWVFAQKDNRRAEPVSAANAKSRNEWLSKTRIDSISARNLHVVYQSGQTKEEMDFSGLSIKQLKVFSLSATVNSIPFKISGMVNNLMDLVMQKPEYMFNLDVLGADMSIKLSGNIGDTQNFKNLYLKAEASGNSLRQTLEQFNVAARTVPSQSFTGTLELQGELDDMQINRLQVILGGNKLQADYTGSFMRKATQFSVDMTGTTALKDRSLGQFWGIQPFTADMTFTVTPEEI